MEGIDHQMRAWRLSRQNNLSPGCADACGHEGYLRVNVCAYASVPPGCHYILCLWSQSTLHNAIRAGHREDEPEDQPAVL